MRVYKAYRVTEGIVNRGAKLCRTVFAFNLAAANVQASFNPEAEGLACGV